jgi:hypothetical protein
MNGFEPVTKIGQGTPDDDAHGIIKIGFLNFFLYAYGCFLLKHFLMLFLSISGMQELEKDFSG